MCRNSVVSVVEIEKESISTTVTTLLRHVYDHMETRLKYNFIFMHLSMFSPSVGGGGGDVDNLGEF